MRDRMSGRRRRGAATAEYAITIMAAVGFAGLLVVILRSGEVQAILTGLVTQCAQRGWMNAPADERGSVVAEFAVAMPAVLLVLATALGGVQLAGLQLQAQDAAADAARSYARGESAGVVAGRLQRQVPGSERGAVRAR